MANSHARAFGFGALRSSIAARGWVLKTTAWKAMLPADKIQDLVTNSLVSGGISSFQFFVSIDVPAMNQPQPTHSAIIGYLLWIFGFTGAHRFYFGRPITGTIWFFTFGLFGVGWLIDAFLIPGMERDAAGRYQAGPVDYSLSWILLTFFGWLGLHRFYMGKIVTGLIYLLTGGLFAFGILYDFWTLNGQVSEANHRSVVFT